METKKIKIVVNERSTKDGRKFLTYRTFSKNGRATEVKFRKEVKQLPSKNCYAIVNVDDMNLNTSGEYPVVWIKSVVTYEDFETANAEANAEKINEYFG